VRVIADAVSHGEVHATVGSIVLANHQDSPAILQYHAVPSGTLDLALSIGGTAVTTRPLAATAGSDYTLLVAGTAAAATVAYLQDDNSPSTSVTTPVKMRLVNGLNGSGSSTASLTANSTSVASGIPFGEESDYVTLAESDGAADIQVNAGGRPMLTLPDQTLLSGGVYTVFLLGEMATVPPAAGSNMILDNVPVPVTPASGASS
jgi:hypothetical protein